MVDRHDVVVETAQMERDDGTSQKYESLTVLGLLGEIQKVQYKAELSAYPKAILNERFLHGDQIVRRENAPSDTIVDDGLAWPAWLSPTPRNVLRNYALTWAARVTRDEPSIKAWPNEAGPSDPASANTANAVLSFYRLKSRRRALLPEGAWNAQSAACVAFKAAWDPDEGPKTPEGQPLGDIKVEMLTIFDFGIDPTDRIEDAQWCFFRSLIDKHEARSRLWAAGIKEEAELFSGSLPGQDRDDVVEVMELWFKPSARIPRGLFATIVGGQVVDSMDFPYEHGQLPVAIWKVQARAGHPYGDTHVNDAVPLQDNLNKLHAALTSITAKCARWMKVLLPQSMLDVWGDADEAIGFTDAENANAIRVISAPPPSPLIVSQIEEHERMISQVFGVNEQVEGSQASQSKNARHLAYISELDAQKLSTARRNLDDCLLRLDRQVLRLAQQFIVDERLIRIVGPQGAPEIVAFRGADLDGMDVILEPAPGADQSRAAQALDAEQDAALGYDTPERAGERRRSGLPEAGYEALARRAVQVQIGQVLQGYAAMPDPVIPAAVAQSELQLAIEQHAADPYAVQALQGLLAAYAAQVAPAPAPAAGGEAKVSTPDVPMANKLPEIQI